MDGCLHQNFNVAPTSPPLASVLYLAIRPQRPIAPYNSIIMFALRIQQRLASRCPRRLALTPSSHRLASSSAKSKAQAAAQRKAAPSSTSAAAPRPPRSNAEAEAAAKVAEAAKKLQERVELRKKLVVAIFIGVPIVVLLSYHLYKRRKCPNPGIPSREQSVLIIWDV